MVDGMGWVRQLGRIHEVERGFGMVLWFRWLEGFPQPYPQICPTRMLIMNLITQSISQSPSVSFLVLFTRYLPSKWFGAIWKDLWRCGRVCDGWRNVCVLVIFDLPITIQISVLPFLILVAICSLNVVWDSLEWFVKVRDCVWWFVVCVASNKSTAHVYIRPHPCHKYVFYKFGFAQSLPLRWVLGILCPWYDIFNQNGSG